MNLKRHIRDEPDFPDPGPRSRDFTPFSKTGRRSTTLGTGSSPGGTTVAAPELVDLAPLGRQERPWDRELFSLIRYE